jgi:putative membrane-bound dehydrogenase-like protein
MPLARLALVLALLVPGSAFAQKCLHPGFKVELIYQPPEIEHPSVVTCDDDGNLYVGEDPMDMRGPTTKEFDRIIRIEFNPDGSVKKRTVFAENLAAVFGLVWHNGALHVMHAPHYSILRDSNNDGVADERQDVADGFGPPAGVYGFNDHIVTGTQLGMDGLIYVSVGDKGVPKATGKDGQSCSLEGGGVVRFRPDGTQLEVFTSGTRNHLDVPMDSLDNIFTYDNTDDGLGWWTRFTHHIPTGYYGYPYDYHPHPDRHLPRISEHGGGSPVGADCYKEDAWPAKYRDGVFYCEWGKRKVQLFTLKKNGASFDASMEDFLVPEEGSEFRPQDVCFSPDGKHMYVADWEFGGWVQPKVAGRLYRVTYVGNDAPKTEPRAKSDASISELVQSLGHAAHAERMRVQWKLAALGQPAVEPVTQVLANTDAKPFAKIHAIWTLNALRDQIAGYDPTPAWIGALRDKDGDVRAQAARALGLRLATSVPNVATTTEQLRRPVAEPLRNDNAVPSLIPLLKDQDGAVRLQAAVALGRIGSPVAVQPLLACLKDQDVYARFAAIQAIRAINSWKPLAEQLGDQDVDFTGSLVLTATGVYDEAAIDMLIAAVQHGATPDLQSAAIESLSEVARKGEPYVKGWWGTQPAKGKPPRAKSHDWSATPRILAALREGLKSSNKEVRIAAVEAQQTVRDPDALAVVRELAARDSDETVRREVMAILAAMKDADSVPSLAAIATDSKSTATLREQAVKTLQAIGGDRSKETLRTLVSQENLESPILIAVLRAAESSQLKEASGEIGKRLLHADAAVRASAASALAATAGKEAAGPLTALLKDDVAALRQAALKSLADVDAKDAVPEILKQVDKADVKMDAMLALAKLSDRRALSVYLEGLVDKNPDVRNACGAAVNKLRGQIGNDIRELHLRNELSPAVRRELGALFASPAPVQQWLFLGGWSKEAVQPQFDFKQAPEAEASVKIGDRDYKWRSISTTHPQGMVDATQHSRDDNNIWAMAYARIESKEGGVVTWALGSDDQAVLNINGDQLFEATGDRGWSPDANKGQVKLLPGVNHVWFKTGNSGGPWQFSLSIGGPDPSFKFLYENVPPQLDLAAFREHAIKNPGKVENGEKLFFDKNGIGCAKCHSVGEKGDSKVGPNLLGIGQKYPKDELIRSVLEPSARIFSGYELTVIVTMDGQVVQGIAKTETEEAIDLTQADGKIVTIKKADIDEQTKSNISAMPNGLEKGMSLSDFADIVAFLESQKQAGK